MKIDVGIPNKENDRRVDVVVVGAGTAGMATSKYLSALDIGHVVLERDTVGSSWRHRWDSFTLVTPAWSVRLPGLDVSPFDPDSFLARDVVVELLESYARQTGAPVRVGVEVRGLRRNGAGYVVITSDGNWSARAVVVASGALRRPRIPDVALPAGVTALHAVDYRRPDQLVPGAVLVVGSGQTGTQLADELRRAGRDVYLSTSAVGRVPRRYRGRDIAAWLAEMGRFEQATDQVPEAVRRVPQAALSGRDGGRTMALQQLARDGVNLLGRLVGSDDGRLLFAGDLAHNMKVADASAEAIRSDIDRFLEGRPGPLPPPETDPVERPLDVMPAAPAEIDVAGSGISTVLWCTGMRPDSAWLPNDLVEPSGVPHHRGGVVTSPGMYMVGFPWQTHRASGLLYGMATDAALVADQIKRYLASR